MNNDAKKEKTGRKSRKIIAAAVAVIIVAAGGSAAIISSAANTASAENTSFREYSVSRGDITMGAEESGTVSLDREYVSFPCSAETAEVYVKTGVTVSEGDPLLKVDPDDVAKAKKQYELKISSALTALEEAQSNLSAGTLKAQQTLESSLLKGSSAQSEYELYIAKQEASKQSASDNLADLKKQLAEYEEMTLTYDGDYEKLTAYEDKLEELEGKYKEMEKQLRDYEKNDTANNDALEAIKDEYTAYTEKISDTNEKINSLKTAYEEAKAAYDKALEEYEEAKKAYSSTVSSESTSSDTSTQNTSQSSSQTNSSQSAEDKLNAAKSALNKAYSACSAARTAYTGYYEKLGDEIADRIEEYEDRISDAENVCREHQKITDAYKTEMEDYNLQISEYREEYEDYKADFTDIYGNNDSDSIAENIKKLKTDIGDAELNIESSAVSEQTDSLSAKQQAESAASEAEQAQLIYERTVASLENEVQTRQEEYDELVEEYAEFCENAGSDGVICSPVSGRVASVSVSEGDNIAENINIVTIMDSSEIYLSASVSEEDISALTVGQECSISLTAYENKTFDGEIDTISAEPARSSGSVSYTVTVKLDGEAGTQVLEGMSGDITFLQHRAENVLYVNINAVTFRDGYSYVKVYDENGNAAEKEVVTGFTDGRYVEIVSGLSEGEKVLAEISLSGAKE